jgi:hypothetical protein
MKKLNSIHKFVVICSVFLTACDASNDTTPVVSNVGETISYTSLAKSYHGISESNPITDSQLVQYFEQFFTTSNTTVSDSYRCNDSKNFKYNPTNGKIPYTGTTTVDYNVIINGVNLSIDGQFLVISTNGQPHHKTPFYYNTKMDTDNDGTTADEGYSQSLGTPTCTFSMGNSIQSTNLNVRIPLNPLVLETSTSTSLDTIGTAFNGVSFFNEYQSMTTGWSLETDAFDQEADTFDSYLGHPQHTGVYHYHVDITSPDSQITSVISDRSTLLGFALDGFPIYGPQENGRNVLDSELDTCRGHVSTTTHFGDSYHYHVKAYELIEANTADSYIIGCYSGTKGSF